MRSFNTQYFVFQRVYFQPWANMCLPLSYQAEVEIVGFLTGTIYFQAKNKGILRDGFMFWGGVCLGHKYRLID